MREPAGEDDARGAQAEAQAAVDEQLEERVLTHPPVVAGAVEAEDTQLRERLHAVADRGKDVDARAAPRRVEVRDGHHESDDAAHEDRVVQVVPRVGLGAPSSAVVALVVPQCPQREEENRVLEERERRLALPCRRLCIRVLEQSITQ